MATQTLKSIIAFYLHTLAVVFTWLAPFLISWKIALAVYAAVMLQFAVWGKCLMNRHHGLDESGGRIFYTELLEKIGFQPDPYWVKTIVRQWLYPVLAGITLIWQIWFNHEPLWF